MIFNRFDICLAWYAYASDYHSGMFSPLYRVFGRLEKMKFNPGNAMEIYQSLVQRKVYQ